MRRGSHAQIRASTFQPAVSEAPESTRNLRSFQCRPVHPQARVFTEVCRRCAVRFEPLCAFMGLFDTFQKCFRAGLELRQVIEEKW
jgi:hypothetical protein